MPLTAATYSHADRFRQLYDYERDCNAKVIRMLESVPQSNRSSPQFERALSKAAHMQVARHMWLFRLGKTPEKPTDFFPKVTIEQLATMTADVERRWLSYLPTLEDADLFAEFEYVRLDGKRRRWPLIELFTQLFGHAWYHRGQVASLAKDLGGVPIDADYIFWNRPTILE